MMQISPQGLQAIIQREGVILHAYQDSVGVWTIGTGHTSAAGPPTVTPGLQITKEQNDEILLNDLKPIENQFTQYVHVPITQNQYDAILSIVFNVGPKFWHSTTIQRLNAGDIQGAAAGIMQWCIPKEIIGRRRGEQKQFLTPDSVATSSGTSTLDDVNMKVNTFTSLIETVKNFFKNNFTTNVVPVGAAGATAATTQYHVYWPYALIGGVAVCGLVWLGIHFYQQRKLSNGY